MTAYEIREKVIRTLTSRKLWAGVIAVLVATNIIDASEVEEAQLIEAILVVMTALGYIVTTAWEDIALLKGDK